MTHVEHAPEESQTDEPQPNAQPTPMGQGYGEATRAWLAVGDNLSNTPAADHGPDTDSGMGTSSSEKRKPTALSICLGVGALAALALVATLWGS